MFFSEYLAVSLSLFHPCCVLICNSFTTDTVYSLMTDSFVTGNTSLLLLQSYWLQNNRCLAGQGITVTSHAPCI